MERKSPTTWFTLFGGLGVLATLAFLLAPTFAEAAVSTGLTVTGYVLVGIAVLALVVGLMLLVRREKVEYRAGVARSAEGLAFTLWRTDGRQIGTARCLVRRLGGVVREAAPTKMSSGRPSSQYPQDFESLFTDGALPTGRYKIEWQVRTRDNRTGESRWTRVARMRFRVDHGLNAIAERFRERGLFVTSHSHEPDGQVLLTLRSNGQSVGMVQCEVRRRLDDGSLAEAYLGHPDNPKTGATQVELRYPSSFRREVGQTHALQPGGFTAIESRYAYPPNVPGHYDVLWRAVWYVASGTFEGDYTPTVEDFRREAEIAQDRFTISD
jgi:hypothetical protein